MSERELATSVTITNDELYINGRAFPFYIDPEGPMIAQGSRGGTRAVLVPVMVSILDGDLIADLRGAPTPVVQKIEVDELPGPWTDAVGNPL